LVCNKDYYYEESVKKCVIVDEGKKITNCLNYDNKQACIQCSNDLFFIKGACSPVEPLIENCQLYNNDKTCGVCK